MDGKKPVRELYSALLDGNDKKQHFFKIISYEDAEGRENFKFGISEYFWGSQRNRWLPSNKHHSYLSLDIWAKLLDQESAIRPYIELVTGDGRHSVNADTIAGASDGASRAGRGGRPAKRTDVRQRSIPDDGAPQPRPRGRPPKCAKTPSCGEGTQEESHVNLLDEEASSTQEATAHP